MVPPFTVHIVHTITEEHRSAIIPSVEDLFLEHNLGDQILRGPVHQIPNGNGCPVFPDWKFEMANLLAHCLHRLGSPLRVAERVMRLEGLVVQELQKRTNIWYCVLW